MDSVTKNSAVSRKLMDWAVPLGPYDCLLNAVTLWLSVHHADPKPLYRYNFTINYYAGYDWFDAAVPVNELFHFLRHAYGVESKSCRLDSLDSGKMYLLPVDAYYVPYMKELYGSSHMLHYVLAEAVTNQSLRITDPYFKKSLLADRTCVEQAWRTFSEPVMEISPPLSLNPDLNAIRPYLTTQPYEELLPRTFARISERIMDVGACREPANLMDDPVFKQQFGCIRTIALSRLRHFGTCSTMDVAPLGSAWRKLEVSFMKMTISLDRGVTATVKQLKQLAEDELAYLHSYATGGR
ncbi:hypothetical protein MHH28_00890 [Paenibacillus sp. FSL K6-1217]|uniref:hypothetical protein n=1 Tax=Paenibacillus sp. FSL K6-1217 TaxID=2921466 RepID=UPI00324DCECC